MLSISRLTHRNNNIVHGHKTGLDSRLYYMARNTPDIVRTVLYFVAVVALRSFILTAASFVVSFIEHLLCATTQSYSIRVTVSAGGLGVQAGSGLCPALLIYIFAGFQHEACAARMLSYARQPAGRQTLLLSVGVSLRQPAGGRHCQSGPADWLLHELQLRRAYGMNGGPRPGMLIIGGDHRRSDREVQEGYI